MKEVLSTVQGRTSFFPTFDTTQHAGEVARHYRLRYQIELVIRDAFWHTGLTHWQAHS